MLAYSSKWAVPTCQWEGWGVSLGGLPLSKILYCIKGCCHTVHLLCQVEKARFHSSSFSLFPPLSLFSQKAEHESNWLEARRVTAQADTLTHNEFTEESYTQGCKENSVPRESSVCASFTLLFYFFKMGPPGFVYIHTTHSRLLLRIRFNTACAEC